MIRDAILLWLLLLSLAPALNAQQIRESATIAPDVTLNDPSRYAPYASVALLDSTDMKIDQDGSATKTTQRVIKIMNAAGAKAYRTIIHTYNPLLSNAYIYRATIYKANGDVYNLDITLQKNYASPISSDGPLTRQAMVEVGPLDPGDILDYQINQRDYPPIQTNLGSAPDTISFKKVDEPTCRKVYRGPTLTLAESDLFPPSREQARKIPKTSEPLKGTYRLLSKRYILHTDGSQEFRYQSELELQENKNEGQTTDLLTIRYDTTRQKIEVHHAYIRTKDGKTIPIPASAWVEGLAQEAFRAPAFNHWKERRLRGKHLLPQSTIVLDYSLHTAPNGHLDIFEPLRQSYPTKEFRLEIECPPNTPLNYTIAHAADAPRIERKDTLIRKIWTWRNIPESPTSREDDFPYFTGSTTPDSAPIQYLRQDFERHYGETNPVILTIAESLIEHLTCDTAQIQALRAYVQELDNTEVTPSMSHFGSRSIDEVISSAYATRIEKSYLLASLLGAAGFQAEPLAVFSVPESHGLSALQGIIVRCTLGQATYLFGPDGNEITGLDMDRQSTWSLTTGLPVKN